MITQVLACIGALAGSLLIGFIFYKLFEFVGFIFYKLFEFVGFLIDARDRFDSYADRIRALSLDINEAKHDCEHALIKVNHRIDTIERGVR